VNPQPAIYPTDPIPIVIIPQISGRSPDKTGSTPFTHTAYFFVRTGMRKGRVYGYWKDGGKFRPQGEGNFFAFTDMLPRGGWDGRIQFVKFGDPPPGQEPQVPMRPGDDDDLAQHERIEGDDHLDV
jgi:hypothetical protein